jgi:hypothetical protein
MKTLTRYHIGSFTKVEAFEADRGGWVKYEDAKALEEHNRKLEEVIRQNNIS